MKKQMGLLCALLLGLVCFCTGCTTVAPALYEPPDFLDVSSLDWVEAFDELHGKMSKEYAFTELRSVNWDLKKGSFRPIIEKAWEEQDMKLYYLGLREYLFSLMDGHVALIKENHFSDDGMGFFDEEVGGGFGLTCMLLDDGRLIANWVDPFGPAYEAGMKAGSEILLWEDEEGIVALKETSALLSVLPQATTASRTYEQTRFLLRGPVGTTRSVTFKNPDQTVITAHLTAIDDDRETLRRTEVYGSGFSKIPVERFIESKLLQDRIGYIKLYGEGNLANEVPTVTQFKEILEDFEREQVHSLILDLRGNMGGADAMAAAILGFFYEERTFYEYTSWYNTVTQKFEILQFDEVSEEIMRDVGLYIEPESILFSGKVIALINHGCISSGEGIAMGIRNLTRGETLGFGGTNGSFGMVGGPLIHMPGGYLVMYPIGRSLDIEKNIQLDSDGYNGGVLPTITIPMTIDHALAVGAGFDVELDIALSMLMAD